MRILLVKLSSLGDVVHNFPVASDIRRAYPDATIDWVTEAPYAPLVAMHPAINTVYSVNLRALKKAWWRPANWSRFFADKAILATQHYDLIVDTQGLVKSAMVASWADGLIAGFDRQCAREAYACRCYRHTFNIPAGLHAVQRNRELASMALGHGSSTPCDYGLNIAPANNQHAQFAVLLHGTSRDDKTWPVASWVELGRALNKQGLRVFLPSGNTREYTRSVEIAAQLEEGQAVKALPLTETAALLAGAHVVVGVDTGLTHLAVAVKTPAVGIYVATRPALTGLYDQTSGLSHVMNLDGTSKNAPGHPAVVSVNDVLDAIKMVTR